METLHKDNSKVPNNYYDEYQSLKQQEQNAKGHMKKKRKMVKSNDTGKKINKGDIGEQACVWDSIKHISYNNLLMMLSHKRTPFLIK